MRRLYLVFAFLILCLSFTGCGKASQLAPDKNAALGKLTGSFETSVSIRSKGLSASATISRSPNSCTMLFTQPETLRDMVFMFSRDNVELRYRDLDFSFAPSSAPVSSIPQLMVSAIDAVLRKDGLTLEEIDNALVVTGRIDSGPFTMELDVQTGELLKLSIPGQELEIVFQSFHFID